MRLISDILNSSVQDWMNGGIAAPVVRKVMTGVITGAVTHASQHHADEVLACAMLLIAKPELNVRCAYQSEADAIKRQKKNLLIDYGKQCKPDEGLFDHHQEASAVRKNKLPGGEFIKYSAAGLVWKYFSGQILRKIRMESEFGNVSDKQLHQIAAIVDEKIVVYVDAKDNNQEIISQSQELSFTESIVQMISGTEDFKVMVSIVKELFKGILKSHIKVAALESECCESFEKAIQKRSNFVILDEEEARSYKRVLIKNQELWKKCSNIEFVLTPAGVNLWLFSKYNEKSQINFLNYPELKKQCSFVRENSCVFKRKEDCQMFISKFKK